MNAHIQETAKILMQLLTLEERLGFFEEQDSDTAELEELVRTVRTRIPAAHLTRHDRLRAQGKRSVAECREGVCSGCHMKVATGLVPALLLRDAAQTCDYCGRFLYVAGEPKTDSAEAAKTPKARTSVRAVKNAALPRA